MGKPGREELGLRKLDEVILESHDCSAEELISRLRFAVEEFCKGTEQKDDLTAVVLKRKAATIPAESGMDHQVELTAEGAVA